MEVLRYYTFREVKAANGGELFERVLAGVGPEAAQRGRMLLEDRSHGASAIDRAVKRYPELDGCRLPIIRASDGTTRRMLSNVDAHHPTGNPCGFVSPQTLIELVRGVPRSYPFWKANIFFMTGLPWQDGEGLEELLPGPEKWVLWREPVPHVSFEVGWWPWGYRAFVRAAISLGNAETFGQVLPPVPGAASTCLTSFGKPTTRLMLRRTDDESTRLLEITARLRALHEEWRDRSRREMAMLPLPHSLPAKGTGTQYNPVTLSHKPTLLSTFKPRGYRYSSTDSGPGCFVLHKLTPNRNRVEIFFDVGSKWRHYTGGILIQGLRGSCVARLPAHPEQLNQEYDIANDETWQKLVENIAVLVDHLERVFVSEIDAVLGRTPDWYEWFRP